MHPDRRGCGWDEQVLLASDDAQCPFSRLRKRDEFPLYYADRGPSEQGEL